MTTATALSAESAWLVLDRALPGEPAEAGPEAGGRSGRPSSTSSSHRTRSSSAQSRRRHRRATLRECPGSTARLPSTCTTTGSGGAGRVAVDEVVQRSLDGLWRDSVRLRIVASMVLGISVVAEFYEVLAASMGPVLIRFSEGRGLHLGDLLGVLGILASLAGLWFSYRMQKWVLGAERRLGDAT
jgi:hypothetical protein